MALTTSLQPITLRYNNRIFKRSFFTAIINWCKHQQDARLLWLAIVLAGHGCVLTPLTIALVILSGNSLPLFILAIVAMQLGLVTNLAALPTKITIPAFALSILIDLGIMITCLIDGLSFVAIY